MGEESITFDHLHKVCLSLLDNFFFFWQSAQLVQNFNVGHESCDCVFGDDQRELCNP